jgi:hypothetical protein
MNKRSARQRRPPERRAPRRLIAEPGQGNLDMTPTELASAGELIYGPRWRSALAQALNRTSRTIRYYERGERRIPADFAARVRAMADIGTIGVVIRNAVKKAAPDTPIFTAHKVAIQVLSDLTAARFL